MFLDIEQGMQFLRDSKLQKTEMICAKCSKTVKVCKAEDTVDKWCSHCERRKENEMCIEPKHIRYNFWLLQGAVTLLEIMLVT
jgi:predicted amidophosphoribosyltransferase